MTTIPAAPIAVIGAGPGGLICARVLQNHGVDATVYDLDASATARDQGGSLDMHPDSGQIALTAAGLLDEFAALARPESQQLRLLDQHGAVLFEELPEPDAFTNPEIDRGQLRDLLLGSLRPGTVQWGHRLERAETLGGGRRRLHFGNGRSAEHDLVIGADGAWSQVRALLTGAVPQYTGVVFVEALFNDVDTRHPRLAALTGDGTMMALYDNRGFVAQRNASGHIRVYIAMRTDEGWLRGVDAADTGAVRAALLERFEGWDPALLAFITDNEGRYVNRPLYALPVPHEWEHVPGLTLLGDAAHLMSPFSGQGANLAMLDGAELGDAIASSGDVDEAVHGYEKVMLPRSAEAAEGAAGAIADAIAADAPAGLLAHFTARR